AKVGTLGAGNTPVWDGGVKFTNDAATQGDGLGGTELGNEGALTKVKTAAGFNQTHDDTNQKISTTTPGGMSGVYDDELQQIIHTAVAGAVLAVLDGLARKVTHQAEPGLYSLIAAGASGGIAHVVNSGQTVALGDTLENLGVAGKGAFSKEIMDTFADNIKTTVGNMAQQMAKAAIAAGIT